MTQGERVKAVRKEFKLTLDGFGERLGVTKVAISNIERGNRNLTEQMLKAICREFNVNEDWLRTGEGEMLIKLSRQKEIAKLSADLFKAEEESFKSRLIMALASMNDDEWRMLENLADKIARKKD